MTSKTNAWKSVPTKYTEGGVVKAGLTDEMARAFWDAFSGNEQRGSFEQLNAAYNAMIEAAPVRIEDSANRAYGKSPAEFVASWELNYGDQGHLGSVDQIGYLGGAGTTGNEKPLVEGAPQGHIETLDKGAQ